MRHDKPLLPVGEIVGSGEDKAGRTIVLRWEKDVDPPNRGFVGHRATAWHGDDCLGYLRTDYVDAVQYKKHNPTIWNHMANFIGICWRDSEKDPRTFKGDEAVQFRTHMMRRLGIQADQDPGSYKAFMEMARKTYEYGKAHKSRKEFFAFHLENPYVGYAQVRERPELGMHADSRGQGVGKLLYAATAIALNDMGLPFRSSGLQSGEAKGIWTRMAELGWAEPIESKAGDDLQRFRLIADRIPETVFRRGDPAAQGPDFS